MLGFCLQTILISLILTGKGIPSKLNFLAALKTLSAFVSFSYHVLRDEGFHLCENDKVNNI